MPTEILHPVERIYHIGAQGKTYGSTKGICRITGKESTGIEFKKWVKNTFTDIASLKPGTIVCNQALFCFDESSEIVQANAGKDKPQRFRTYSHIIDAENNWHCCTKADKERIYNMIVNGASLVCLTDSGQKHLLFKHRNGMWQLDDLHIVPDVPTFENIHSTAMQLLELGFNQGEIISGNYPTYKLMQQYTAFKPLEAIIAKYRGKQIFKFSTWLLWTTKKQN